MRKRIRLLINIFLIAVLLFGTAKLAISLHQSSRSREDYDYAEQLASAQPKDETEGEETPAHSAAVPDEAVLPDDPVILELLDKNLDALRKENEDVIGWIYIPDTAVNYPLVQWTDNDFYLTHTWNQTGNPSGAIFMDCSSEADFSLFNTIIYGHNMYDGTMFAALHDYRRPEFREEHPSVYIVNDEAVLRFDVFAVQFADTDSIIYGLDIESEPRKKEFIRFAQDYSFYETEINPDTDEHFLTLSTCTGGGHSSRCVVICVLNGEQSYNRPD